MEEVLKIAEKTGIQAVQLHGKESNEMVQELTSREILVIKAFFQARNPKLFDAALSKAPVFLAEPGIKGLGGTGSSWRWDEARSLRKYGKPYLIAGGIHPGNVVEALKQSEADGADLSSGVEKSPGVKDHGLIEDLMEAVRRMDVTWDLRRVFI
jgi:phosphoribosylanthranilate isomerase